MRVAHLLIGRGRDGEGPGARRVHSLATSAKTLCVLAVAIGLAACNLVAPDWGVAHPQCLWPDGTELAWAGQGDPVELVLTKFDPVLHDSLERGDVYVSANPMEREGLAPDRQWCHVVPEAGGFEVRTGSVPEGSESP